jgi:hypothetical protein
MTIPTIHDPGAAVSEKDLTAFEERRGFGLPTDYRDFLKANNGGRPQPSAFPINGFELNPYGVVQAFFSLKETEMPSYDLDWILDDLQGLIPCKLIPVACTGTDDYVCLDLRQLGAPVMFWDRKSFWGSDIWRETDLYLVAPSFALFLSLFCDLPE